MNWDLEVLEAIRATADDWEFTPGNWRAVLDLCDRTSGADRRSLEEALVRMIDEGYRNPASRNPEETPWGAGNQVPLPNQMRPEDLACIEAALLTCAERGVSGAYFPAQRLLAAPRWHALMSNLRWLHAELMPVQRRLSLLPPGRIVGGMLGLATGDALGCTLEFGPRLEREHWHTEITGGGPFGWAAGAWTDDTDMALAVAEGIGASPTDPVPAVGERFMAWYSNNPPDVGNTVRLALSAFARSGSWEEAGHEVAVTLGERAGGNGALMRTLPVGLAYAGPAQLAHGLAIARMTHPHPLSDACCAVYNRMSCLLVEGRAPREAWQEAMESDWGRRLAGVRPRLADLTVVPYEALSASGYVVDTFEAAAWSLLQTDSLEACLLHAANLGDDSDTVAAVAGGLAGAAYGSIAVPRRWSIVLQGKERLVAAAERLGDVRSSHLGES